MKRTLFTWLAVGLSTTTLLAQSSASAAGKITYEVMRQVDRSQMRGFGPGGGGGGGAPAPDGDNSEPITMTYTQKLLFSGTMAKEERDRQQGGGMFRRNNGDGSPNGNGGPSGNTGNRPAGMRMNFPMEQQTYLDLANKKRLEVMTVKKDQESQTYVSERPLPATTDWEETNKTKKIAGYECHKATAMHRKVPYTIWYTTDLPFTYSPVADLTPPKGVVMLIESDNESFKATNVNLEAVPDASVMPPKNAKMVSQDDMDQIRRKAMADFRQQMMQNGGGFPPRN